MDNIDCKRNYRKLKKQIESVLRRTPFSEADWEGFLENPETAVSPLFSFLCSSDQLIKWHAVSALGIIISYCSSPENARIIIRRIMWQLNDESGGIGWGCPEALGEILARSNWLAEEYHHILISYIDPKANLLEYPPLLEGALWGVARLAAIQPGLCVNAVPLCVSYIYGLSPFAKACATLTVCFAGNARFQEVVQSALYDNGIIDFYWDGILRKESIAECVKRIACR